MKRRLASLVVAVPLALASGRARAAEPETYASPRECLPSWIPAAELGFGVGLAATGLLSFDARYTGRNPTMPAITTGAGFGAALSGMALFDANRRCAAGESTGPDFRNVQRRVAYATAAMAALAFGTGTVATLTHEPGVGMKTGAYEITALLMSLSAAGTVVGINILLMPEVPSRSAPTALRMSLVPTQSGAAASFSLTY
jgi:hypothetical protein